MTKTSDAQRDLEWSVNRFGFELLERLRKQSPNEDILLSPLSIASAFSLVYFGARGGTKEEMDTVFEFRGGMIPGQIIGKSQDYGKNADDPVCFANRAFIAKGMDIPCAYISKHFQTVDFTADPESGRQTINDWLSSATNGTINDLIKEGSILSEARLVLSNALHFKGVWENAFSAVDDVERVFRGVKGKTKTSFMKLQLDNVLEMSNIPEINSRVLNLPYADGRFSMYILLPNKDKGWKKAEQSLKNLGSSMFTEGFKQQSSVLVEIPKWEMNQTLHGLKKHLTNMGMNKVFSDAADLSGLTGKQEGLHVTDIFHQMKVTVEETGNEASAAGSANIDRSVQTQFIVDHPFLFFVRDKADGSILFQGSVLKMN